MTPYDRATPLLPAWHLPALVLELARSQDVDPARLARAVGLDRSTGACADALSPVKYLALLGELERALDDPETPHLLGRHLLPGHFGSFSPALAQAATLREALDLLVGHAAAWSPLLVPRLREEADTAILWWTEACGVGRQRRFVVDLQMTALAAYARWRGGPVDWTFCLNRTGGAPSPQLQVHLGSRVRQNCQVDAVLIDRAALDKPWPASTAAGSAVARRAAQSAAQRDAPPCSLLGTLYDLLLAEVQGPPSLEDCAERFGMSLATLKRRLAAEGTHYQAELDRVRSHVALFLFRFRGCDNDAVAEHLGFHDAANFRRSFKRWTGVPPRLFRDSLFDGAMHA
jgi:AraC-like DNA-binding protein